MRLRVSGSREEIREQYMPLLASKIVSPLIDRGAVSTSLVRYFIIANYHAGGGGRDD